MSFTTTWAWTASGLLSLLLVSCSTPAHLAFEKVELGQGKTDVLELVGSPNRTKRSKGQDKWTYVFYQGEMPIEKVIKFEEGKVVAVQNANGMNSIEQKIINSTKRTQRNKPTRSSRDKPLDSGFQDLNGDDSSEKNGK